MVELLERIGAASLAPFWAPVLIWTGLAGVVVLSLTLARGLHPLMGYRLRQAVLLALPASILVALWLPSVWGADLRVAGSELPSHVPTEVPDPSTASAVVGASEPVFAPPVPATVA